jgi:hypothetical protein
MDLSLKDVLTPLATVIAVFVTSRLSLRRTSAEKIWEVRRQAYSEVIAALTHVEKICDSADEMIAENAHWYFDSPTSMRHNEQISQHLQRMRTAITDNYVVLSPRFVAAYDDYLEDVSGSENDSPPDEQDTFSKAVRRCRRRMLEVAREEIAGIKRPFWNVWSARV